MRLVADIGGTHARFALFQGDQAAGWDAVPRELRVADYEDSDSLLEDALVDLPALDGALFAIAGSAHSERMITTGSEMEFDRGGLAARLDCEVYLRNDFAALAWGIPQFSELRTLGEPHSALGSIASVIGPGSGLGMASLCETDGGRWVLEGGGGHSGLSPGNHLEAELWGVLAQHHAHVCWETVLSGSGIVHLYRAMCAVWGSEPESLSAEEISSAGASMSDMVCHQTLETFCGLLGSAAGDLALTVGATRGIFLVGGILPQIADFLASSPIRRRFEEKGLMSDYVRPIPLHLVQDSHPGLIGARAALLALSTS